MTQVVFSEQLLSQTFGLWYLGVLLFWLKGSKRRSVHFALSRREMAGVIQGLKEEMIFQFYGKMTLMDIITTT